MSRRISRRRTLSIGVLGLLACGLATAEAGFRFPRAGAAFAAGATVEASWNAPCDRDGEHEGELVLSLDDGLTFPIRLTGEMPGCVSGHDWQVPDVATSRARLGLRKGQDGDPGDERIVLVSAPFAIGGGGSSDRVGLTRGAVEWWTDQALAEFDAEDFLDQSFGREAAWCERRAADDAAEVPGPGAHQAPTLSRSSLRSAAASRPDSRRDGSSRVPPTRQLRL